LTQSKAGRCSQTTRSRCASPTNAATCSTPRDTLGLTDTDISEIGSLPSVKGAYSTLYMISKRGRGAVRVAPGIPEYWIASSNPEHDQPRRHAALKATGGDAWQALLLLCEQTASEATVGGRPS